VENYIRQLKSDHSPKRLDHGFKLVHDSRKLKI